MRTLNSLLAVALLSLSSMAATGCAADGAGDQTSETDGDASSVGKFDLWQATDGQWHFHLKSGNGKVLLTSEAYTTRTGAINGILSTQTNGVDPAMYQVSPAATGYTLHLVAGNNEIIAFSEIYASKSNATRAIASCTNAVTSYLDKREAQTTGARLAVQVGDTNLFHWNFIAQNGQIVLTSEAYTTEAAAYDGAFAVQGAAATAYTVKANAGSGFYFVVTATNGQIIGTSQQYTTKQAAQAGVVVAQKLVATVVLL